MDDDLPTDRMERARVGSRRVLSIAAACLGALLAFLAAAGWFILLQPDAAHGALLAGVAVTALGALAAGRLEGRLAPTPDLETKHVERVRLTGALTRLLAYAALVVLLMAAALIATQPGSLPGETFDRVARIIAAALAAASAATVAATLSARRMRPAGWRAGALGLAATLLLAAVAVLVHRYGAAYVGSLPKAPNGLVALVAATLLGLSTVAARGVPPLVSLTRSPAGEAAAPQRVSIGKAAIPVAVAFSLVLLVFLAALLFGVGVGPVVEQVSADPALAAAALFVLLLLLGTTATILVSGRRTRTEALFKERVDPRKRFEQVLLASSLGLSLFFLVPGVLLVTGSTDALPQQSWPHLLCVGLLIALGPYGFYAAREQKRIRRLEERFPDFLRDVASSHKGGLTLPAALLVASRGEYGPLTPEIQKMADQLRWNVAFTEALQLFSDRVRTPLVQRAVNLILEANRTGGSTTGLLLAAARDAREIKSLETDRRLSMSLYTVVIYVTFFVFLGVAAILYAQFLPQLVASGEAAADAQAAGTQVQGLGGGGISLVAFQKFYFLAAIMQGLGDGLVAGMMGTGRAVLGLQHAFWMVLFAYVTFSFLL
ncbi:MAG TPA: type II secretion system F family protein [Candidatus Thermoplasmatota archaeon]|nr:type II secretion system F family protein [Candidatus Thermoplasmatota archaeon]